MTNFEFVEKLKWINTLPTLYGTGAFGAVVGLYNNRERYAKNSSKKTAEKIMKADDDTFLFDCINYGKSVLWDFSGDFSKRYGGAVYKSNGVPDFGVKNFHKYCTEFTEDHCYFPEKIEIGEWLRTGDMSHIAYYIGNNQIIECTQQGEGKTRIESLDSRYWDGHGKLQYITYRIKGDVNGDGVINAKDYMLCKRIVLGTYSPTPDEFWAADVTDDGKVNALDYMRIKRMVMGK